MDRNEHLQWCKDRAMEYIDQNEVADGVASFMSDMTKHPETEGHSALELMTMMLVSGQLETARQARKFIEGFN